MLERESMVFSVKMLFMGTTEFNVQVISRRNLIFNWALQTLTGSPEFDKRTKGRMKEMYQLGDQGFSFIK